MPPTPELAVTVQEDKLADWCVKQRIGMPTVRIVTQKRVQGEGYALGTYVRETTTITLYVQSDATATAEGQRLLHVTRALNATFLHELRHHWQWETLDPATIARWREGPYHKQKAEVDAEEFAAAYKTTLPFIRVKRSVGGGNRSGFGRLGAAQKGARR